MLSDWFTCHAEDAHFVGKCVIHCVLPLFIDISHVWNAVVWNRPGTSLFAYLGSKCNFIVCFYQLHFFQRIYRSSTFVRAALIDDASILSQKVLVGKEVPLYVRGFIIAHFILPTHCVQHIRFWSASPQRLHQAAEPVFLFVCLNKSSRAGCKGHRISQTNFFATVKHHNASSFVSFAPLHIFRVMCPRETAGIFARRSYIE